VPKKDATLIKELFDKAAAEEAFLPTTKGLRVLFEDIEVSGDQSQQLREFIDVAEEVSEGKRAAAEASAQHAVLALFVRPKLTQKTFWSLYLPFASLIPVDTLEPYDEA
jgi:hypothetical protein